MNDNALDRRALASQLMVQLVARCRALARPGDWFPTHLDKIERYLAGQAEWFVLHTACTGLSLSRPSASYLPHDETAHEFDGLSVTIEKIGRLLVSTDDDFLEAALRDAAMCLGWDPIATALANSLDPPPATDVLVALLPNTPTHDAIKVAQLLPDYLERPTERPT